MGRLRLDGGDPWAAFDAADPKVPREPQPRKAVHDFSSTGRQEEERAYWAEHWHYAMLDEMERIMRAVPPVPPPVVVAPAPKATPGTRRKLAADLKKINRKLSRAKTVKNVMAGIHAEIARASKPKKKGKPK